MLEDERNMNEFILKKLTENEYHPYSRVSFSFVSESEISNLNQQAHRFYEQFYKANHISLAVVSNKGNSTNAQEVFDKIEKIFTTVPPGGEVNEGEIPKHEYGLPFRNLPRLIAYRNKARDSIRVTFQVKTDFAKEAEFEAVKFATYLLTNLLREKFHESKYVHHVLAFGEYFSDFAFIHVNTHMSHPGKDKVDEIIAIVLVACEEIKKHVEEEVYLRAKENTFIIYNTAPLLTSKQLAIEFARRTPKFGFASSFRATKTLNRFNEHQIKQVFDQLKPDHMLVILSGDFEDGKVIPGPDGNSMDARIDLHKALRERVTRTFKYRSPVAGSIVLNGYFSGFDLHYHSQSIDDFTMEHISKIANSVLLKVDASNPYKISPKYAEVVRDSQHYLKNKRKPFDKNENLINPDQTGFYYRVNQLFALPSTYINLRFLMPVNPRMSVTDVYEHHVRSIILARSWKKRVSLIRNYVEEFNGRVVVEYENNAISVSVYAANEHFEKILNDLLDKIDIARTPLGDQDYIQALDYTYRELLFDPFSFDQMQKDFEMLVTKFSISAKEVISYIEENHHKIRNYNENPQLVFGLVEGDLTPETAQAYLSTIQRHFKTSSTTPLQHLSLKYFEENVMHIFRFNNLNHNDNRVAFMMNIDMGKLSIMNYGLAKMYQVLFEREFRLTFIKRLKIASRVRTRVMRVSDHLVFQLMTLGNTPVNVTEVEMERFLARAKTVFEGKVNHEFMEKWREVAISRIRTEKQSVFDYAHADSRDLFLSYGKFENLKGKAVEMLRDHITVEDARTFINQQIIKGKRLVYEHYFGVTDKTLLGPENPDAVLKHRVHVHTILNNIV